MSINTKRFGALIAGVAAAALLALPGIAAAQHGGFGGGGHAGGGGGAHFGGGGFAGGHSGGFSGGHYGGFTGGHYGGFTGGHYGGYSSVAPRFGYAPRYSAGSRYSTAPGYTPHLAASSGWSGGRASGWSGHSVSGARGSVAIHSGGTVHGGVAIHSWYGPHWGYHPAWGGGWWGGYWWPRAYYGWAFPWFFPVLPVGYATFWWGGVPFYYVNSVYYTWDPSQSGYVVTNPPPVGGDDGSVPPDQGGYPPDQGQGAAGAPGGSSPDNIFMYPQNGQSQEQQSTDRYECHKWAQDQTGFDPTQPNGGSGSASPDDYRRAMIACLAARGYSVQ